MKNKLLHTLEGLRDLHPSTKAMKNEIEYRIMRNFTKYGYEEIQTPTFEYNDIYHYERGADDAKKLYKFFNKNTDVLALRPDITPSIARYVATFYNHQEGPKRFSYLGNVFINNDNYQGKYDEFTQAGVECIGIPEVDGDAEVITLAVESLLATGLTEFQIDLGHTGFFRGLAKAAGLNEEQIEEARKQIDQKNFIGLEELLSGIEIETSHKKALLEITNLYGGSEILDKAMALAINKEAKDAIQNLKEIYEVLCEYGIENYISFDLGTVSQINYYTGVIFKGYTYEIGGSVVDGGRYDKLLGTFDYSCEAVGFAIKIDDVMNALTRQKIEIETEKTNTLLVYKKEDRKIAIELATSLRKTGMKVELYLYTKQKVAPTSYGKEKKVGGVMEVNGDDITLINLQNDTKETITIQELMEGN